jgi:hypothetical protein
MNTPERIVATILVAGAGFLIGVAMYWSVTLKQRRELEARLFPQTPVADTYLSL